MKKIIRRLKLNKKGFTLLECVVSILIIGIMCGSMLTLFQQGIKFISKAQKLDASAGQASQIMAIGDASSTYLSTDGGDNYYADGLPVKIQFTVIIGDDKRTLAAKQYQFRTGVVINAGNGTKVVYYDISSEELTNLK